MSFFSSTSNAPSGLRAAATNFGWLAADHGVRFGLSVLVGFWMARHLGPSLFGELHYLLALVTLVAVLGEAGIESVVRRQIITHPEKVGAIMAGALRIRLGGVIFSVVGLAAIAGVSDLTIRQWAILGLLAVTLVQPLLALPELWIMARLAGKDLAMPRWVAIVIGAVGKIACILANAPLAVFGAVIAAEAILSTVLVAGRARKLGLTWAWSQANRAQVYDTIKQAAPLLLSSIAVVLYLRIDVVMLRNWRGVAEVGQYAAAVRFSEMLYFLPGIIAASVLPALMRAKERGQSAYIERFQRYFDITAGAAILLTVVIVLMAPLLVGWGYGIDYNAAIPVLKVHAVAMPFVFLGVARTQYLVNERLGWFHFGTTSSGAVINVLLNLWLIPERGALGAAIATVISYAMAGVVTSWCHPKVRTVAWAQAKSLLIPFRSWRYLKR